MEDLLLVLKFFIGPSHGMFFLQDMFLARCRHQEPSTYSTITLRQEVAHRQRFHIGYLRDWALV